MIGSGTVANGDGADDFGTRPGLSGIDTSKTEAQALRSRGDEYREYQEITSAFIPWFPKERR